MDKFKKISFATYDDFGRRHVHFIEDVESRELGQLLERLDGDRCSELQFDFRGAKWMIGGGADLYILSRSQDGEEWEDLENQIASSLDDEIEIIVGGQTTIISRRFAFTKEDAVKEICSSK